MTGVHRRAAEVALLQSLAFRTHQQQQQRITQACQSATHITHNMRSHSKEHNSHDGEVWMRGYGHRLVTARGCARRIASLAASVACRGRGSHHFVLALLECTPPKASWLANDAGEAGSSGFAVALRGQCRSEPSQSKAAAPRRLRTGERPRHVGISAPVWP